MSESSHGGPPSPPPGTHGPCPCSTTRNQKIPVISTLASHGLSPYILADTITPRVRSFLSKNSYTSKESIWVNSRSPRESRLRQRSYDASSVIPETDPEDDASIAIAWKKRRSIFLFNRRKRYFSDEFCYTAHYYSHTRYTI